MLGCLGIASGIEVGIAQAAQLGHRQSCLGPQLRQLGARRLRFSAQGVGQQKLLESVHCRLLLAERKLHLALCQLKAGAIRGFSVLGRASTCRAWVRLPMASKTLASSSGACGDRKCSRDSGR